MALVVTLDVAVAWHPYWSVPVTVTVWLVFITDVAGFVVELNDQL
jgi:hypothetical protein